MLQTAKSECKRRISAHKRAHAHAQSNSHSLIHSPTHFVFQTAWSIPSCYHDDDYFDIACFTGEDGWFLSEEEWTEILNILVAAQVIVALWLIASIVTLICGLKGGLMNKVRPHNPAKCKVGSALQRSAREHTHQPHTTFTDDP
jgi:hypothetical protein